MNLASDSFGRVLVLAAHPDDETIACSGLLQRANDALVVLAVDGAPPRYGFEKKFGSLQTYSDMRFREASRALEFIPCCSLRRLVGPNEIPFVDQHLFLDLPAAFTCLVQIARAFAPDLIVSHAFEGGHIDHDACHVLAQRAAHALGTQCLEFPVYWKSEYGKDIFQQFRESRQNEFALHLSQQELLIKRRMLAEYRSQVKVTSVFHTELEHFRPISKAPLTNVAWHKYPFENRYRQLKTKVFLERVAEFQQSALSATA